MTGVDWPFPPVTLLIRPQQTGPEMGTNSEGHESFPQSYEQET